MMISSLKDSNWAYQVDESGQWIQHDGEPVGRAAAPLWNESGANAQAGYAFDPPVPLAPQTANSSLAGAYAPGAGTEKVFVAPPAANAPTAILPVGYGETVASPIGRAGKVETQSAAPAAVPSATQQPTSTPVSDKDWAAITAAWNARAPGGYRLYQQMSEHGWTVADLAQASGQSKQQIGDYLTSIGAEAGFGGAETIGREAVDRPFVDALRSAENNSTFVHAHAVVDESGRPVYDESGSPVVQRDFDVLGFTRWYVAQDTDAARAFARIQGSFSSDGAGGIQFASSAHLASIRDESGVAGPLQLSWTMDSRISAYQGYAKGNLLDRAAMTLMVQTPQNDQILQTFGNPNRQLPENELGERMRALYGTELATCMLNLQDAVSAMKSQYMTDLNAELAKATSPAALGITAAVHIDESGNAVYYDESGAHEIHTSFDVAAFQQQYASRGAAQKLTTEALGAGVTNASEGGFSTAGSLDQLKVSMSRDESGTLQAQDVTLSSQDLTTINIADPPDLYDSAGVWFLPMAGFVTSTQNIKPEEDWFDQVVPIIIVAAVSYFSAGTLGPAAAGAMGLTTATGALTVGGVIASAAVAGAVTSAVSGMLSGNLSLKGILQGALSGALTAGLFQGLNAVAGPQLQSLGTVGKIAATATVQGTVQALMGGSFKDGAIAGFATGLASAVSGSIDSKIADALSQQTMSPAEASAARYFSSMVGAAIKIVGLGEGNPAFGLASAFLNETFNQVGQAGQQQVEVGNALGSSLADAASSPGQTQPSTSTGGSGGGASGSWGGMEPIDYSLASGGPVRLGAGSVEPVPTPEELQAAFRQSERDYRSSTEQSVAGSGYVARSGDGISRIVGSSDPQAIGNFMRANNLTSDRIEVGRNYFVPDDVTAYGDSAAVGQFALNQGNERIAAASRSETQREMNRFAAMSEGSGAAPVWNMRDASAALRAQSAPAVGTEEWFRTASDAQLHAAGYQTASAYDPAAVRVAEVRRESLLNYLNGQGNMALGGLVSAGVMIGTGDVVAASATTDAVAPLDNLLAPIGGGATRTTLASGTRRGLTIEPMYGSTRTTPLGFEGESQFLTAARELQTTLRANGVDDAVVGVRGSSITGFTNNPNSPRFGQPFGAESDIDFFVQSSKVVEGFKRQPDFVHPDKVLDRYPDLELWSQKWSDQLGRSVTPAAWKPGALPQTPAILVR